MDDRNHWTEGIPGALFLTLGGPRETSIFARSIIVIGGNVPKGVQDRTFGKTSLRFPSADH